MKKVVVLDVVGLTPALLEHAPRLRSRGAATPLSSPLPAVTSTSQATMLTGAPPSRHGIVGNGWYFQETGEIRFWQQSNRLLQAETLYQAILPAKTAKLFWWFNQAAPVQWSVTPKPHYGCDGSKEFGILDRSDCQLEQRLGPFPFASFWGPLAGLPASRWIADAAAVVIEQNQPELTLVYLPHLDYDYQRQRIGDPQIVHEVDACAATVLDAADRVGAEVVVVSEYGLVPVARPVYLQRTLRQAGWLEVRDGPFGEMLMPMESRAFAVVDHQLAHIYVRDPADRDAVRALVEATPGVQAVVDPADIGLGHSRSGQWVALAEPNAWFVYYFWLDDQNAPDFARCVDIHRKPGYDPCELFMTSKMRAGLRLAQKKLGMRYRMDVVPLKPELVGGSHGLHPPAEHGPLIIGEGAPSNMQDVKDYLLGRLRR